MNVEELKEAIKRIGQCQQESQQDLEIVLQQIQNPVGLDLLYQCAKNVIEFRQYTMYWKSANKILMEIVKVCLNNRDQLKAWETIRLTIDPDKHFYKCHELVQIDEDQFSHQEFTQQEFCANLQENQDVDALYEDEKGNVIGWCRANIVKINEKYVWVKWYENEEKRKIARYSMDLAPFKSQVTDDEWEWRHSLNAGDIIDCFDNRVWQNATIIAPLNPDDNEYVVGFRVYDEKGNQYDSKNRRFFGWNQQYDERIKAISPRIQKKNAFSRGQPSNPHCQEEIVHDCNDFLYPKTDYAVPRFQTKQARRSTVICEMINEFGKNGLFQYILDQIINKCTIDFLHSYMVVLNNFQEMLNRQFVLTYVPKLFDAVQNNILLSADNNLRNFSSQKIIEILQALSNLLKRVFALQKRQEMIDRLDLDIAYKCFTSDFLERKIQGLKAIQELIKKTKDQYNQYGMQEQQKQQAIQMILEWLNEKKIFESLYVGSGNSHLVQRSAEFFKFLIEEKMISINNFKEIWNSLEKAEYEHKLAIFKLFKDVSNSLEKEWLDFLTDAVCSKDPKDVTKDDLELLLDIIKMNYRYKDEYIQKCCNYYWTVLKSGQLNQTMLEQYISYYIDQVTQYEMRPHKGTQISMIGESIINGEQVNVGLRVLIKLIEKLDIQPAAWEQYTRNVALTELENKFKIVDEIIKSIPELKKQKDYLEEIKIRMQFIQFFYQNINTYEYRLTFKIISSIWEQLVCQSSSQQEKDLVYKWFSALSTQDGQSQLTSMVAISDLKSFFNEKMTNDLIQLTEEGFNCFKTVLTAINKQDDNSFGLDVLWQMILETENDKVSQLAIEYYLQFESTLEVLFNKLQENRNNNQKLYRCLLVLEGFIDQSEINGVGNLKSLNALSQGEELQIQVSHEHGNQKKFTIKIYDNQTIIELRLAISKVIKQQWDSIGLNSLKGEIKFTENGKMIKDLRLKKGEIIMVFRKQVKDIHEVNLLDGEDLSEPAKQVFGEIFSEYSTDGKMSKEDCTRFVTGCTGNPCSIDDANIQRTFEQYDKDKDSILTLNDFLDFYTDSARTKRSTVWLNLQTLHYRNDLIRGDRVPLPQVNAQQLPRGQIVQNQRYLDLLFELLQNSSNEVQEKTWYLLRRLPPSPQLIKQMLTFENIQSPTDWDQILVSSHYRLLYSLYIIEFLMNQQDSNHLQALIEDQEILILKDKWMSKFLQLGGFDKLLQFFKQYQGRSVSTLPQIEKEILSFLLKTFQNYVIAACATNVPNLYKASRAIQIIKPLDQVLIDIRQSEDPEEFKLLVQKLKESRLGDSITEKIEKFITVLVNLIQELLKSNELEQEDRQIIEHSVIVIIVILLHNQELLTNSIENIEFINIFFSGIFTDKSDSLRNLFSRAILVLCHESQKRNNQPTKIILQQLISMQNQQANSSQFYELLSQLIDSAFESEDSQQFIDYEQLTQQVLDNLINHKSIETRQKSTSVDKILIGLLNLLTKLHKFIKQPIHDIIFNDCLFSLQDEKEIKCKSNESRQAAFKLLYQLSRQFTNCENILLNLQQLSQKIPLINRWNYIPSSDMRSSFGYCGIRNLRCICYMNAMLQQFYMTIPFRYGILQADDGKESDIQQSKTGFLFDDNVLHQLQQMFSYLELSDRIDYNPQEFCAAFKDYAGEPVNIFIQQDAQEFLNMIFDKLENLLKNTVYKNILDGVFGGKTCTQIECQNCKAIKNKDEIFYNLSVPIKNLKNLQECFDKFVQGEIISDFKCESCNQKVDVSKRQLLAQLPNVLILHLQRIVFNLDTFMNEKINSRLEFPINLDLAQYTINQDQCTQYKLVGIVVHLGTADVGHYFSYIDIKSQDQWLEFNDHKIKEFKLKQMENECFGGQSNIDYNDNDVWGNGFRENSQSAYMLIYEKVQKDKIQLEFNSQEELQEQLSKFESYSIQPNNVLLVDYNSFKQYIPSKYHKKVNSDNQQFLLERNLFNQEFMKFILDISDFVDHEIADVTIEILIRFSYDLLARAYENSILEQFNNKIIQLIQQYPNPNYLDLIFFGKQAKVQDLLLVCPESRTRKYFGKMLSILFNQTIQIQGEISQKIQEGLDFLFLMLQDQVPKNWTRFDQYFQFWLDFIQEGKTQMQYCLDKDMILYMIDFILDKSSPLQLYEKKTQMGNAYFPINCQIPMQIISTLLQQNHQLTIQEKKLLYLPKFYDKALKSTKTEELIPIILKFAYNNRYFSEIIAGCIMRGLGSGDSDDFKNYLLIAKPFLLIKDNLQIERLEWLIGIPSSKQKETAKVYDNQFIEYPQFGLYGLISLEEDYWTFASPLGWQNNLFEYFCTHRTIKNNDNQCLLILKLLLMISLECDTCFDYISKLPCVNYQYKYMEEIFKAFIETYIVDTKRFYSQYPRKQETDETKIYLDQYCNKISQIHNEFQPQFDFIIGKTVEVTKVRKTLFLYNPCTKEEIQIDEGSEGYDDTKQQIEEGNLHKVLTMEEKIYTTHVCDNMPNGNTNEALPQQYVKGTQISNYSVDPNCQAANFIQSKAWSADSDDKATVINPGISDTVKQIQIQNHTNRNLHVILEIKGDTNPCHYIPKSKIQSLMSSKSSTTMFTAIKTNCNQDFPPLQLTLVYKKQEPRQDSYIYLSSQDEMNLELL
ncbi:unnamed protein product [Paramecium sonneborni]|uniref:Ubiquitinyl hydrolase 1 n=1 Tax=Paramecium sonneborni TaxID=65129 RepID=A0A8S1MUZ2_9CILI|nr:unnamed protein product [Paramecium sonneborni]